MRQTSKWHLALAVLFACSAFLRFETLSNRPLWYDESYNHVLAQLPTIHDLIERSTTDWEGDTPPLQAILGRLHFRMSHWEYAVRLPSVEAGILTPLMLALLGALLFDRRTGILAGFLTAFSVYHIEYSQDARQYALLMFLLILMFYSIIAFYRTGLWRYLPLFCLSAAASLYTHHFAALFLLCCLVSLAGMVVHRYVTIRQGNAPTGSVTGTLVFFACSVLVIGILYVPYLPVFFNYVMSQKEGSLHVLNMSWRTVSEIVGRWGNGTRWSVFYLALLGLGILRLIRLRNISIVILPWFLIPFFVFSLMSFTKFFDVRFLSGTLPPFFLLLALGIVECSEIVARSMVKLYGSLSDRRSELSSAAMGVIVISMIVLSLHTYSTFRKTTTRCSSFPWNISVMEEHNGFCEKHLILNSLFEPHRFLVRDVTKRE
jgi:mannosyltransferase